MLFKRIACPYLFPLQSRVPQPMRIFMQSIKHMPNFQILKGEHYRIFSNFLYAWQMRIGMKHMRIKASVGQHAHPTGIYAEVSWVGERRYPTNQAERPSVGQHVHPTGTCAEVLSAINIPIYTCMSAAFCSIVHAPLRTCMLSSCHCMCRFAYSTRHVCPGNKESNLYHT